MMPGNNVVEKTLVVANDLDVDAVELRREHRSLQHFLFSEPMRSSIFAQSDNILVIKLVTGSSYRTF